MLTIIGVGTNGIKGISLEGIENLRISDIVYIERFTSFISDSDIDDLKERILDMIDSERVSIADRWFLEDGKQLLDNSFTSNVCLITYGDPFIATTTLELYIRALKLSIPVKVIHGPSGITSLIGESGLHYYKFGRTVTMMSDFQSARSVYNVIYDNLFCGNHTLILTEYRIDSGNPFFLSPNKAIELLYEAENSLRYNIFNSNTFMIICSRIGTGNSKFYSGKTDSLYKIDFGLGPHSIIIPSSFHFTEQDALPYTTDNLDLPSDNTTSIERISSRMVNDYTPRAKKAALELRKFIVGDSKESQGFYDVIDNAEFYLDDAVRFLNQGKYDLAVLSVGYAEGLIDAIRFQKGINPW